MIPTRLVVTVGPAAARYQICSYFPYLFFE